MGSLNDARTKGQPRTRGHERHTSSTRRLVRENCSSTDDEQSSTSNHAPEAEATITVAGLADDSAYTKACIVAQELADALGNHAVECQYFMEQPWDDYLRVKQAKVRGRCISHKTSPLILVQERGRDHYVGSDRDLDKLFQAELGRPPSPIDMAAVDKTTLDRYLKILSKSGNPYVYLDVQFAADRENTKPRKVVIELFSEICPKSCAHFRALCTGQLGSVEHEGKEVKFIILMSSPRHYGAAPSTSASCIERLRVCR